MYKDILRLDRHYAENNPVVRVLSCKYVRVAVYCVIALLLIGNCAEDRILCMLLSTPVFRGFQI